MIKYGYKQIEDCPERYLEAVKKELGLDKVAEPEAVEGPANDPAQAEPQAEPAEEQAVPQA